MCVVNSVSAKTEAAKVVMKKVVKGKVVFKLKAVVKLRIAVRIRLVVRVRVMIRLAVAGPKVLEQKIL